MIKQLSQLFGVAAFLMVSGHPVQATTHQDVILGGVNLTPWCQKQYGNGFKAKLIAKTAGDWTCERSAGDRRPISVSKACILQYGSKAYKAKALNWQDPYSWKCLGKNAGPTPASNAAAECNPGAKQVAFFEHSKYRGACVVRKMGRYSNSAGIGIGNDKISSIKVSSRTQVRLCKDNDFRGGCKTYTKSTPSLGGMNDKTSSAIIEKISPVKDSSVSCRPNANQVAVFEHVNYKGACALRGVGNYKNSSEIGVANDTISSVLVGGNVAIVGYKHTNFGSVNLYGDKNIPHIKGPPSKNPLKGGVIPANAPGGGDAISSIKVIKRCK